MGCLQVGFQARFRTALQAGALVLLVAPMSCGPSDLLGLDAPQGIEGVALRGPLCPVASEVNPCPDQPYRAWIEIRNGDGRSVTSIQTGEDGRFRVGLEPGSYTLIPEQGDPFPSAMEQEVEVEAGAYVEVTVLFDTGIRE